MSAFVCSHGKEWMKGESAGYFGAGGDAKRKGPFTVDPCNILIPGDHGEDLAHLP